MFISYCDKDKMHEGRKDVVSGKHMVIFEKVQCDENKEQRGKEWERGFC